MKKLNFFQKIKFPLFFEWPTWTCDFILMVIQNYQGLSLESYMIGKVKSCNDLKKELSSQFLRKQFTVHLHILAHCCCALVWTYLVATCWRHRRIHYYQSNQVCQFSLFNLKKILTFLLRAAEKRLKLAYLFSFSFSLSLALSRFTFLYV